MSAVNTIAVVIEREFRDEECDQILAVIRMIKGVLSVTPNAADFDDIMSIDRARSDLSKKLWKVLYPGK